MKYVGTLEERYGTKNFNTLLDKMTDQEYQHFHKLESASPMWGNTIENSVKSDTITLPDITVGRSIGAKAKNHDIELPSKEIILLSEGTKITNVQVIAGKGRNREIDIVPILLSRYTGTEEAEWQKVKGIGYVDYHGESYKADLHWYQEPSVGKVEWKVKPDADGNWFIDED